MLAGRDHELAETADKWLAEHPGYGALPRD